MTVCTAAACYDTESIVCDESLVHCLPTDGQILDSMSIPLVGEGFAMRDLCRAAGDEALPTTLAEVWLSSRYMEVPGRPATHPPQ